MFIYYDIHLLRINLKQIIKFLRDHRDIAYFKQECNVQPLRNPELTNANHCQQYIDIITALIKDVEEVLEIMHSGWNFKMNTVRTDIDSAMSAYDTTQSIFWSIMADAITLCNDALSLYDKFNAPTHTCQSVIKLIKSNISAWQPLCESN